MLFRSLVMIVLAFSYVIANHGATAEEAMSPIILLKGILGTCCFIQFHIVCTRFFSNMWINFAVSYVICGIYSIMMFLTLAVQNQVIFCVVFAIAYILLVILAYYFARQCTAALTLAARDGFSKDKMFKLANTFYKDTNPQNSIYPSLKEIRQIYKWDVTCQGSVPAAFVCFYESVSYETFLRNVFKHF